MHTIFAFQESSASFDLLNLGITLILILLNGFFVAAEFALVKMSESKINLQVREKKPFAPIALWLYKRQNLVLSACQLGITIASLGLGRVGEPAVAHIISPWIEAAGITSEQAIHNIAFVISFSIITALHIIIGEQVPKIYAIRKPSPVFVYSAWLLRAFYILLYPFMWVLNQVTLVVLRWVGVEDADGHDTPLSEEEIRHNLSLSHAHGELTKNEHSLLTAVFRFDDEVARHIMVPRSEVDYLDANLSFAESLAHARKSPHTRFPLCDGSLDQVLGVLHIKDFLGHDGNDELDLRNMVRTPLYIPENMPIGQLMQEFRTARQHFAFIQDEHGTTLGTVTLEDVLEELVGSVQDEFDNELPEIAPEGNNQYSVDGRLLLETFNEKFGTNLIAQDADTLSGYLVEQAGHKIKQGQKIELQDDWVATLTEVKGIRATRIKISKG
ncbi:MAG TPA: hypothetical protein DCE41_17085 [Cytophagales bacterium]|nr:hypothetical protein [Cytophagales bacterium]HAA18193.1 hypothetical protein [Cytophagales bacterium]HAP59207.1 hypothetical protein [Cytophagales bacterium]